MLILHGSSEYLTSQHGSVTVDMADCRADSSSFKEKKLKEKYFVFQQVSVAFVMSYRIQNEESCHKMCHLL